MLRSAAFAIALVAIALVCAASGASAASKKISAPPVFATIPFSFNGNASGLPNNDALLFLNATAGASGLIQVELNVTSGQVQLQACPVEICFRSAASINGRRPVQASTSVVAGGQPWLLLASGEASDAVPWWFWLSNVQPLAAAAGSLRITLLETVVVNATTDSVDVAVDAGQFRLFKVESGAGVGAALKVSFTAQDANTFQFFRPSDVLLPGNVSLSDAGISYTSWGANFVLYADDAGTPSPATPERSGTYYLTNYGGTDGLTWWLVAGSRNQQASNATLSFTRVATTPLTTNAVATANIGERGQVAVFKLAAVAGSSGHVRANLSWTTPDDGTFLSSHISAGLIDFDAGSDLYDEAEAQLFVAGPLTGGLVNAGASRCLWDDSTTDWWVVVYDDTTESAYNFTTGPVVASVQVRQLGSLTPDASGSITLELDPADIYQRLIRVPGVTGGAALRLRSQSSLATGVNIVAVSGAVSPESGVPGTICGGPSLDAFSNFRFNEASSALLGNLYLDNLYLASHEGLDWYVLVNTSSSASAAISVQLLVEQITATSLALDAAQPVSLFDANLSYGMDVRVFRVDAAAANVTAAAGLDVSYTINRNSTGQFPGQSDDFVPFFAGNFLSVYVSSDTVVAYGQAFDTNRFSGSVQDDTIAFNVAANFACGGQVSNVNASTVDHVTASGRFWTDASNLLYVSPPPVNVTAASRVALAQSYRHSIVAASNAVLTRSVADDSQQRNWYVVVVATLAGTSVEHLDNTANLTSLSLSLLAKRAPVVTLQSGVPVLSPASPQNQGLTDINVPAVQTQLYRLPSAGPGTSGLASLTTSGSSSSCSELFEAVSPATRVSTGLGFRYGFSETTTSPYFDLFESEGPYALSSESASLGPLHSFGFPLRHRVLYGNAEAGDDQGAIRWAWLQSGDNTDDTDWYVTLLTSVNQVTCSFVLTLHDTVLLEDDPTDEFGSLRWTAQGVPVTPLSQTLFKLPARLGQRGLINSLTLANSATDAALDLNQGPLALTLQAQTVPMSGAGLMDAYYSQFGAFSGISVGQLFTLPFVPTTKSLGYASGSGYYSTLTFGGGAFAGSLTGTNNDQSDVYLLGVSRNNFTVGTTVVDLSIGVTATRALCNAKVTCNNNGKCLSDGSCDCKSGYGGQFCSCKDKRDCSGHGICGLSQGCICDSGYSGADCSKSGAATLVLSSALLLVLLALVASLF